MNQDKDIKASELSEYTKYYDRKLIKKEKIRQIKNQHFFKEKILTTSFVLVFLLIVTAIILFVMIVENRPELKLYLGLIGLILISFVIATIYYINSTGTKSSAIGRMLDDKYQNSIYYPEGVLSRHDYLAFDKYIFRYKEYISDNFIAFTVNGKMLSLAKVQTFNVATEQDRVFKRDITFRGVAGYYYLGKTFEIEEMFLGKCQRTFKPHKLDNDKFNELFDAVCEDEIALYKFLTPTTMEKLIKIKEKNPTIEFVLLKDKLYFRFEDPDYLVFKNDKYSTVHELFKLDKLLEDISNICIEIEKELNDKLSNN